MQMSLLETPDAVILSFHTEIQALYQDKRYIISLQFIEISMFFFFYPSTALIL